MKNEGNKTLLIKADKIKKGKQSLPNRCGVDVNDAIRIDLPTTP